MIDKLKGELKRALRSRMNATINSVCVDFEEHVDLSSSSSASRVEYAEFDRYFDCCRQFVKYIGRTMDTSPNFAEKMDCIILASRNGASQAMLNAVVKQDVWFHRRGAVHPEKQVEMEDTMSSMLGKRKTSQVKPPPKRYRADQTSASQCTDDTNLTEDDPLLGPAAELPQMEVHESEDEIEEENDENQSVVTGLAMNNENSDTDRVGDLCQLKPQLPGQLEAIKTWIHDVNMLIDAKWCMPPTAYACSQDCAQVREKMKNESELRRTWQRVEAHLDECQRQQCELKTRVELRQTTHLIEGKQLEICGIRCRLKDKKVTWSMAVHNDSEGCWVGDLPSHDSEVKLLEKALQRTKVELAALESKKAYLFAHMDSIRLDWRDEMNDSPGADNASHYVREA
ncbi:hypothetical protein PHYPSEUDO_011107 [Phytophthora pseudosyringae]|uniref:Uncharacterized protein n=1 Tax=Phytophthora pseudosyringae TaxID=221518 RepID=A0A8T1WBT8_9STRA|nr:hypothetical protein PHYPSEUDO_011107 [Phytophthora pseudosyringae]